MANPYPASTAAASKPFFGCGLFANSVD